MLSHWILPKNTVNNYRPNGWRWLGRPLKRLLDKAKHIYQGLIRDYYYYYYGHCKRETLRPISTILWNIKYLYVHVTLRGSKAVCPMSQICSMLKTPGNYVEIRFPGQICQPFLTHFRSSLPEGSHVAWCGAPLGSTGGTRGGAQRAC